MKLRRSLRLAQKRSATVEDLSKIVVAPASPSGMLFLLPLELRMMIYEDLIKAGRVNFLQTSRSIYSEARGLLYKHGTLQIGPLSDIGVIYQHELLTPLLVARLPFIQSKSS